MFNIIIHYTGTLFYPINFISLPVGSLIV